MWRWGGWWVTAARSLVHLWPELASRVELTEKPPAQDPEAQRWRVFQAVAELVRRSLAEAPFVAGRRRPAVGRTLHAAVARPPGASGRAGDGAVGDRCAQRRAATQPSQLLGDLGTARSIDIVRLDGLDAGEVGEFVGLRLGQRPPDEVSGQLRRHTGGNPFFLAALLAHLDETSSLRAPDGGWVSADVLERVDVPAGVRGVIASRLARLDGGCRRALDVAAVCGLTFDERVVRGVMESDIDETVEALDAATASGLVREEGAGQFAFAHALVRHAVLDELSTIRLARLHWRIGEALERDPNRQRDVQEVAHHYAAGAEIGDDATIVRTSLAAGEEAHRRLAFDEAATHLQRGLTRLDAIEPDPDLRYRINFSLGHTLNALDDPGSARKVWSDAIDIARRQRNPERLFAALMGYRYVAQAALDIDLVPLLDEVLELLGDADSPTRALALALRSVPILRNDLVRTPQGDPDGADEAVAMARRTGDRVARVSTLRARLARGAQYPDLRTTRRDVDELTTLLPIADDAISRDSSAVLRELTRALLRLGRRTEAEHRLALADEEVASNGLPVGGSLNLLLKAALATASGQLDDGERLSAEAARSAGPNSLLAQRLHAAQSLALQMERGQLDTVIQSLRHFDKSGGASGWTAVLAGALADAGRRDEAALELRLLLDSRDHRSDYAAPLLIRYLPEVCRQLGDGAFAAALLPDVEKWSAQILVVVTGTSIEGAADRSTGHLLATLGRFDDAIEAYTAAADLERAAGFPPLAARTSYWHARALLERDAKRDRDTARAMLDDVISTTERLGMSVLARQAIEARV